MNYLGSKFKHAKQIVPLIEKYRKPNQLYVEPFIGGANIFDKIKGPKIAFDIDDDVVLLWQSVSGGWIPPETVSEEQYNELKYGPKSPLRSFAAYAYSFGSKKFAGFKRGDNSKGIPRDYTNEAYRNALKQFPLLRNINVYQSDYKDLNFKNCLIYCDPPYAGTTKYTHEFDHDHFWKWVDKLYENDNTVLISEYNAPPNYVSIWQKQSYVSFDCNSNKSKKSVENLFIREDKI